ncbi:unnamed protein product [Soboliphyme baturini]|uniref:Ammonium_transp domain-containing protein n=1 Tax=Soboliphyme baturini TaxID=241478 RepID=A0A183J4Q7_9BILA|nr:unnamed protein product [Soboliphyme baturini]
MLCERGRKNERVLHTEAITDSRPSFVTALLTGWLNGWMLCSHAMAIAIAIIVSPSLRSSNHLNGVSVQHSNGRRTSL